MRETRACKKCGGEFSYERKRKSGRSRLFCSATCKAERLVELNEGYRGEGRYRVRARAAQRAKIAKMCVVCGFAFQTVNPLTRCCGPVCGHRLLTPRAHATRSANAIIRRTRTCQRCGVSFVARNPSGKARRGLANEGRFCSRACAHAVLRKYSTRKEAKAAARARARERIAQLAKVIAKR
jgi:hypothetical protein